MDTRSICLPSPTHLHHPSKPSLRSMNRIRYLSAWTGIQLRFFTFELSDVSHSLAQPAAGVCFQGEHGGTLGKGTALPLSFLQAPDLWLSQSCKPQVCRDLTAQPFPRNPKNRKPKMTRRCLTRTPRRRVYLVNLCSI